METVENKKLYKAITGSKEFRKYFSDIEDMECRLLYYEAGESVRAPGREYLYYLYQGRCKVSSFSANGKTHIINMLKAPCLIGEMEFINNDEAYKVSTLEASYAIEIALDKYRDILLNDARFLRSLCEEIVTKERKSVTKLMNNYAYPLKNRLAQFILDYAENGTFRIKKTICAESLGVSYRHLEKVMDDFVKEGLLDKKGLTYHLSDIHALEILSALLETAE